jgi:hypothetical protein
VAGTVSTLRPSSRSHRKASSGASAAAAIQPAQRLTGRWRRRARNQPSSAASSAGSSSVATSRRTTQSGRTLRSVTIPSGPVERGARSGSIGPASSIAVTVRSRPRPNESIRARVTASSGRGGISPVLPIVTAGRPASATTPCPERVSGSARRIHWPEARAPPGFGETSERSADSTERWSASGAAPPPSLHGTTHGLRIRFPAMSPSTSTASTGLAPWASAASRAHARAPAKPVVAPEVETSTSVLRSSRWR